MRDLIKKAEATGAKAFTDGIDRAPCLDVEFINGEPSIEELKAWNKGWVMESLK